jgi:hypothetical protein
MGCTAGKDAEEKSNSSDNYEKAHHKQGCGRNGLSLGFGGGVELERWLHQSSLRADANT